jgi:asparagine synthase (glutamine-hydrolysing)
LCEIFGLGPSKTPGSGVFKQIQEVKPGHFIKFSPNGFFDFTYYRIESAPHLDDFQETVEKTRYLVSTSIKRQMVSDVPICTFLSGGIDSSIVSSICASELAKNSQILNTISFDFTGNDKYFTANAFQPEQDRPYVDTMIKYLGSNHTYLTCNYSDLADYLYASVKTRDLPTMADVDSSLLYFCGEVAKDFKVVLTGECADEIFGGYPWFYRDDLLQADTFPWMKDISPRLNVLNEDFANALHLEDYINNLYNSLLTEINLLPEEAVSEKKRRQVAYLNIKMFMQTLLDRMDRTSMANSLEARVPFADPDVLDYVFNIPWDMKFYKNQEKGLLRFAMQDTVPEEIMYRKKSPYPKSYDPHYEKILTDSMRTLISDGSSPLLPLLDISYVNRYLDAPKDYGKPWFGQLMAGPQMIAYLLQVDYWMRTYNVKLEL